LACNSLHNQSAGMFVNNHYGIAFASLLLILLPFFKGALAATRTKTFGFALDVSTPLSEETFACAKNAGHAVAFIQVYHQQNGGRFDENAEDNIHNALNAKLGVEVFVQPNVSFATAKSAVEQFDELKKNMNESKITFGTVWLVVTHPTSWSNNSQTNIDFITSYLNRARSQNHYVGIYTSWYDWYIITNQYTGLQKNGSVMLWYWNTLGIGSTAVSPRDFNDFRQFGGWRSPVVKQFGIVEELCGVTINRDTFVNGTTTSPSKAFAKHSPKADRHARLVFKPNRFDKLVRKVNVDGSVDLSATVGHNFLQA